MWGCFLPLPALSLLLSQEAGPGVAAGGAELPHRKHQRRLLEQRPMVRGGESDLEEGVMVSGRGQGTRGPYPPVSLQGVIPYLGTFLKDLVMLDAATPTRLQVSGGGEPEGLCCCPPPAKGLGW